MKSYKIVVDAGTRSEQSGYAIADRPDRAAYHFIKNSVRDKDKVLLRPHGPWNIIVTDPDTGVETKHTVREIETIDYQVD